MARRNGRKVRPALTSGSLNELALAYVGRFATTRAKLESYLRRKLSERGWAGEQPADIASVSGRICELGYVDDAAYAVSKSRALTGRGYGARRVREALRSAGVGEEDSEAASELAEADSVEAALRFARRRRLGPFGEPGGDRSERERALAAMVRAGHSFALSKAVLSLQPGGEVDIESLREKA
jgi:regulatory protein